MDFDDFAAVHKAYAAQRDTDFKDRWERMRLLATLVIQPHIDQKKGRLTPQKLVPLPWDQKKKPTAPKGRKLTAEQQRERMKKLVEDLGDELI